MCIIWTTKKEKENAHLFKKVLKSLKTICVNREGQEESSPLIPDLMGSKFYSLLFGSWEQEKF